MTFSFVVTMITLASTPVAKTKAYVGPSEKREAVDVRKKNAESVTRCEVLMSRARSVRCDDLKESRARHGWLGLVKTEGGWRFSPLLSLAADEGNSFNSICATGEGAMVALKGARLRKDEFALIERSPDETCRLTDEKLQIAEQSYSLKMTEEGRVAILDGEEVHLRFELGESCWTNAKIADFDADGFPDLLLSREGGGYGVALFLSSNRSSKGEIRACVSMSGPPC